MLHYIGYDSALNVYNQDKRNDDMEAKVLSSQLRIRALTTWPTFMAFRSVYVCPVPMKTMG